MNLKTITSTSGKAPMGHPHSTHPQRGERGWLKIVIFGYVAEGGDLQGQVRTHKYKKKYLHFIKSDRHFGKIYIYTYTRNEPNVCFTLTLFFWLSTHLYFIL